jgi:hypothetical protein
MFYVCHGANLLQRGKTTSKKGGEKVDGADLDERWKQTLEVFRYLHVRCTRAALRRAH